ncbi:response regulator transcription factor [Sporolactobacillus kofuensis]|uniref:response regulator transcription factor n=1 Tax=Sporolactobacillus kofuensis TaxID=269672 RepID=UPI003394964F
MSPDLAVSFFFSEENPPTASEQEVLRQTLSGLRTQTIAEMLHLSRGTVRNYLSTSIQKMEVSTRQEAALLAKERGWL